MLGEQKQPAAVCRDWIFPVLLGVASWIFNLVIVLALFLKSNIIVQWMSDDVSDAFNKMFSLLIAAIGVMFVRSGVIEMIGSAFPP